MRFFVFGNKDFQFDSLPLRILPELKRIFPEVQFEIKDPNEEFEIPEGSAVIDTVSGIKKVKVFNNLSSFSGHPHVSLHDFDLYSHLRLLEKLGKLKKIKIIGIPPTMSEKEALGGVGAAIRAILS